MPHPLSFPFSFLAWYARAPPLLLLAPMAPAPLLPCAALPSLVSLLRLPGATGSPLRAELLDAPTLASERLRHPQIRRRSMASRTSPPLSSPITARAPPHSSIVDRTSSWLSSLLRRPDPSPLPPRSAGFGGSRRRGVPLLALTVRTQAHGAARTGARRPPTPATISSATTTPS